MISRTKYSIDEATVVKLFESAGIYGATEISPLGAGEYNAVFSAKANGREYAIKIAPPQDVPVLTYEKDMMASEVFWYGMMREYSPITVPQIFHTDFEKKLIPTNYFIMEKLEGQSLDQMELTDAEKTDSVAQMAIMVAQMHKIKNERFGYIQSGLYDDWYQAIRAMTQDVINDGISKGRHSARGGKLLQLIDKHKDVLKKAECSMVNFDIWPPNIICSREGSEVKYAWIDPERSFWGDHIVDFVCLEMMRPLSDKKTSLVAYNSVADKPVRLTDEENIRYAIAQGYLALIMEVEKYFRYTPLHFGWWRNVAASLMLFKNAFGAL